MANTTPRWNKESKTLHFNCTECGDKVAAKLESQPESKWFQYLHCTECVKKSNTEYRAKGAR